MQIGPHQPLILPGSTALAAQADEKNASASTLASRSASVTALRDSTPAQEAAGVILRIQSQAPGADSATAPQELVYSKHRKPDATPDAGDETARMALQHQQALERAAGQASVLRVDPDGVLVSQAASPDARRSQDFVSFAVSAMREYADEQERLKSAAATLEESQVSTSLLPRSLAEVHKLAARFKLFA